MLHPAANPPFAMLHPAANRHPKATHQWLRMGVQACGGPSLPFAMLHPAANRPALKPLTPLKTFQRLTTLTTRHGGPSLPCAMLHRAANRHPKATHQCLLMGVQACRLPALKPLKPFKTLQRLKTLTTRHGGPSLPCAMLHPAANRHPKATHQCLLMGVQACRLPALKPLEPLKTLKSLKTLTTRHGGPSLPFAMLHPAANRHPKATHQCLLMGVQACRLPALKPLKPLKTLKRLKTLTTCHGGPNLPFAMLHPAASRHPKATHQWLLMGVQACGGPSLPFAMLHPAANRPALKPLTPLKTLQRLTTLTTRHGGPSLPCAMLHRATNRHPKATHPCLLMGVQACRLPTLKPLKPLKPLKTLQRLKTLTTRHGGPSLPCAMLHRAANRHPKATHQCLLMGVQACRLPALKPLKPFKTLQRLKTLTTRHGGPSLPCAMLHPAANRHPKATHQCLLMGVQACRLPALKPLKPLKTLKRLKTLTTRHGGPSLPFAMLHPAANRHPKATHQCLLMGVQACRLPALKPLKPLKPFKTLKRLKTLTTRHGGPSLPCAMLHPAANRHPKATHQCLLIGVQACRLSALKALKPLKTLKRLKTLTTRHGGPSLPFAMLHPAANRHPKATHQWLLMGVQACRLPALKPLKPLKKLSKTFKPLQSVMGVQACRLPCFILQPTGTPRPHMGVQACRLPALKRLKSWGSKPAVCHASSCSQHPPFAMLHPAANRHPKATHQWLLMGVQACGGPSLPFAMLHPAANRPALKPLTPLKTLQRLTTLTTRHGGPSLPCAVCHASSCSQPAPQGHTWASKPAVCQPLNA